MCVWGWAVDYFAEGVLVMRYATGKRDRNMVVGSFCITVLIISCNAGTIRVSLILWGFLTFAKRRAMLYEAIK